MDVEVSDMRQLGFTNLAGTAWELTFLSWAADYFVNLDGLLYHLTPDIGVQQLAAWASTNDKINVVTRMVRKDSVTGELIDTVRVESVIETYHREPVDQPSFVELDINIDVAKLLDLGALFKGLLPRR
jgi:hypothetical protein